jgi:hypothetical protein
MGGKLAEVRLLADRLFLVKNRTFRFLLGASVKPGAGVEFR